MGFWLLTVSLGNVIVTLLAGLYPAWRAGRVTPVESIKLV
jgi:ABC-type lipoprotein release transport system permease subunit